MNYRDAGVDIAAKAGVFRRIKDLVQSTATPAVLADMGAFGGTYSLAPLTGAPQALVASTDSVGTKVLVARMVGRHDTIGIDIVHHCANDILVQGARPLFFLDYVAMSRLDPGVVEQIIAGLANACRGLDCALLGGETAELPDFYPPEDYDLVGFIVGAVAVDQVPDPASVRRGDVVLGLPSSGLHTNGYSLARKVLFQAAGWTVDRPVPEFGRTLGEELLEPHRCYTRAVLPLLQAKQVKVLAHLTGGGFYDNIPRSLPEGLGVEIERGSWPVPPLFSLIQQLGGVSDEEMHHVFNMGVGMTLIVAPEQVDAVFTRLRELGCPPSVIGRVVGGERVVRFVGPKVSMTNERAAPSRLRIGILLSGRGRGSNMQAIVEACRRGEVPGEVVRVISTSPGTPALGRARELGVDALFVDPAIGDQSDPTPDTPHPTPCLDARLIAAFREVGADTVALAGFMRKLGPAFLRAFPQRILNIHAALLPCFGGQGYYGRRVHEAVIESGARYSAPTVHFADELYDHGPIILQAVVPVEDDDTPETLAARVLEQEHRLYPEALRLLAEGRLEVRGRRVRIRP